MPSCPDLVLTPLSVYLGAFQATSHILINAFGTFHDPHHTTNVEPKQLPYVKPEHMFQGPPDGHLAVMSLVKTVPEIQY